jgi:hypothetical protein
VPRTARTKYVSCFSITPVEGGYELVIHDDAEKTTRVVLSMSQTHGLANRLDDLLYAAEQNEKAVEAQGA